MQESHSWGVNYPICQQSIPPADPMGPKSWGTGSHSAFNIRICVDADDYLYCTCRSPPGVLTAV